MAARALFLDLDGTLADSLPLLYEVYRQFLHVRGLVGTSAEFEALNGLSLHAICDRLRITHDLEESLDRLVEEYGRALRSVVGDTEPAEGAEAVLRDARALGFSIHVVTSAGRDHALSWLGRTGLAPLVDSVTGGDDVARTKPDPEPYLRALTLSGAQADASFAVEDSPKGVMASISAGIPTLMIVRPKAEDGAVPAGILGTLASFRDLRRWIAT